MLNISHSYTAASRAELSTFVSGSHTRLGRKSLIWKLSSTLLEQVGRYVLVPSSRALVRSDNQMLLVLDLDSNRIITKVNDPYIDGALTGELVGVDCCVDWPVGQALLARGTCLVFVDFGTATVVKTVDVGSWINGFDVDWTSCRALTANGDGSLYIVRFRYGSIFPLHGHTRTVMEVKVEWQLHRAVSFSEDRTCRIWDLRFGVATDVFTGHLDVVESIQVVWLSQEFLSCSDDCTLILWSFEQPSPVRKFIGHDLAVLEIHVDWKLRRALSSDLSFSLRLWDLDVGDTLHVLNSRDHWFDTPHVLNSLHVDWDSLRALSVSSGGLVLWDLNEGHLLRELKMQGNSSAGSVKRLDCSWFHRRAVSAHQNCYRLWDIDAGTSTVIVDFPHVDRVLGSEPSLVLNVDWFGKWATSK